MVAAPVIVAGLREFYSDKEAVRGVDFAVATREVFALLGPNGAGKTSTVEVIEGFRDRDGGHVVLGDVYLQLTGSLATSAPHQEAQP